MATPNLPPDTFFSGLEGTFLLRLGMAFLSGLLIGLEREQRGKPAGISTHSFVIAGSALFSLISMAFGGGDPTRVAAQIVTGVGFLGAGIILKSEAGTVVNLTTAASIWFSAAIGMTIGLGLYGIALVATAFSILVPRVPGIRGWRGDR
jgi:putative Mg2+ transporter-C (MgtC) family protein